MFPPPVTVGNRHDISGVRKVVPDFCELAEEILGPPAPGDEPDLLGDEHLDGDFPEREQRKAFFFNIN